MHTTETNEVGLSPDAIADLQAVADAVAAGRAVDAEVAQRVRERSRKAQQELLEKHGVRAIAVELIRQARDEE